MNSHPLVLLALALVSPSAAARGAPCVPPHVHDEPRPALAPGGTMAPGGTLASREPTTTRRQGAVRWFEGTWDELLAEAERTRRVVFVEFWTPWCQYCKRLERETLRDDVVVGELDKLLAYSVNAEDRRNAKLVERFRPRGYPTLVFLEPTGELRDKIVDFLPPAEFLAELRRIRRNEKTLSDLNARLAKNPRDLDAHYALALKLKSFGDTRAYRDRIAMIRRLDPDARSDPGRRIRFDELRKRADATLRGDELYAFLEEESDAGILFEGWYAAGKLEGYLAKIASGEKRSEHERRSFRAARRLWDHLPRDHEHFAALANNIAYAHFEGRELLEEDDLEWALGVAEEAVLAAPREAYIVDTLACCLYAVGRVSEAVDEVRRCIELEPANPAWKERLRSFLE